MLGLWFCVMSECGLAGWMRFGRLNAAWPVTLHTGRLKIAGKKGWNFSCFPAPVECHTGVNKFMVLPKKKQSCRYICLHYGIIVQDVVIEGLYGSWKVQVSTGKPRFIIRLFFYGEIPKIMFHIPRNPTKRMFTVLKKVNSEQKNSNAAKLLWINLFV